MRRAVMIWLAAALLTPAAPAQSLTSQFHELVRSADIGDTEYAFCVIDLDDRQMIANVGADRPMVPASNMKLITTAAALGVLGPDFVFTTELGLAAPSDPGGAPRLIVVGDGDPAFGDPVLLRDHGYRVDDLLEQWVEAVRGVGASRFVELLIDDRVFDRVFAHPTWESLDQLRISGAQVAGINFYRNGIEVTVIPTARGQSPIVRLFPEAPFLPTVNRAVTGTRDLFNIDRRLGTNQITFGGQIKNRQSQPYFIAIHDPPMVFAEILRHQLAGADVTVEAIRRVNDDEPTPSYQPLHRYTTTLQLVLNRTNQNSQNMFAEALFKRVGREYTGEPGSWDNGAAAIRAFLQEKLGTSTSAIRLADGSGLSRDNRVTAQLLAELLAAMARDRKLAEPYRQSLAHGGHSGTLARRMKWDDADVFGKSGYLRGVSSLSGYVHVPAEGPRPARHFAFSLLFNGYRAPVTNSALHQLQDRLIRRLIDEVKRDAL